jgi:hypothetical protein
MYGGRSRPPFRQTLLGGLGDSIGETQEVIAHLIPRRIASYTPSQCREISCNARAVICAAASSLVFACSTPSRRALRAATSSLRSLTCFASTSMSLSLIRTMYETRVRLPCDYAASGTARARASACESLGAVVPAAVDEEGGCAGDAAQVGAVDVVGDSGGACVLTEGVHEAFGVEPQLLGVADKVARAEKPTSSRKHQLHSSPGSAERTIGWPTSRACPARVPVRGRESQQPIFPQVMHIRRCTHELPIRRHSQPSIDAGSALTGSGRGSYRRASHSRTSVTSGGR